ncbi:MAG: RluA family pseudouridine synthase [Chlamydiota bacterium]
MITEFQDVDFIIIAEDEAGQRLDLTLKNHYPHYSRSYFQDLIKRELISINDQQVKKHAKPKAGDRITIKFPIDQEVSLKPENIPLEILYEDSDLLVINKPAGMTVHPAPGNWTGTFVNALLNHCNLDIEESLRPGIVHRLDKNTSGILMAAKNDKTQNLLIEMFRRREITKEYLVICVGNPGEGVIDKRIARHPIHRKMMTVVEEGGRHATTSYKTITHNNNLSIVHLYLHTGRTHQLRVHMKFRQTPILGDETYGIKSMNKKFHAHHQLLHAYRLKFQHPAHGNSISLTAPPPAEMQYFIHKIHPSGAIDL